MTSTKHQGVTSLTITNSLMTPPITKHLNLFVRLSACPKALVAKYDKCSGDPNTELVKNSNGPNCLFPKQKARFSGH